MFTPLGNPPRQCMQIGVRNAPKRSQTHGSSARTGSDTERSVAPDLQRSGNLTSQPDSRAYPIAGLLINPASMCPDSLTLTSFCGGVHPSHYVSCFPFIYVHSPFTLAHPSFPMCTCWSILPLPGGLPLTQDMLRMPPSCLKCRPSCTHPFCFHTLCSLQLL